MYSIRIFGGAGAQTHAGFLAMMSGFTVVMLPVVLTLIPPSVVSPLFALVRSISDWEILLIRGWGLSLVGDVF
jgi:hypothetical protein